MDYEDRLIYAAQGFLNLDTRRALTDIHAEGLTDTERGLVLSMAQDSQVEAEDLEEHLMYWIACEVRERG